MMTIHFRRARSAGFGISLDKNAALQCVRRAVLTLFQDVGVVGVVRSCADHRFQDHGGGIGVVAFCGEGGELLEQRMHECFGKTAERRKVGSGDIGDLDFRFVRLDEGAVDGLADCNVAQDCLRQVSAQRIRRSRQRADRCMGLAVVVVKQFTAGGVHGRTLGNCVQGKLGVQKCGQMVSGDFQLIASAPAREAAGGEKVVMPLPGVAHHLQGLADFFPQKRKKFLRNRRVELRQSEIQIAMLIVIWIGRHTDAADVLTGSVDIVSVVALVDDGDHGIAPPSCLFDLSIA